MATPQLKEKTSTKNGVQCLVSLLNCIWWIGSSSGIQKSVEYPFIFITSATTQTKSGSNCEGPIHGSNKSVSKLLNKNTWYHKTVYKLFVLRIVIRYHNCLLTILPTKRLKVSLLLFCKDSFGIYNPQRLINH